MLAKLLRAALVALVFWASVGFAVCASLGRPGLGALVAALVLCGPMLVLGFEFLVLLAVRRGDASTPATGFELLRAWVGECGWSARVFWWQQPFRSRRWPDRLGPPGRRGIVFVHGYVCNRGFWNPWLARCHAEARPFVAVNLEPVFADIEAYVPALEAAIAAMQQATGLAPVVVAHSMGGLVLRAWRCATPDSDQRAHRFVTIGTPHQGTWIARWSRTPNARAMRRGSDWLGGLLARETEGKTAGRSCFWGHADNIVMPPSTAIWPGAVAHHLRATAHVAMAFQPEVFAEVFGALDEPAPTARSG
ncbi:MAG TPA: permease [Methylibium sp.]|uniref:esterase/lipase family protein n=1 Tax=Methylibium sp. TaxID=2067992 RepID=UPI002DBBE763|nr:permease [Methylibium sp.]HEU4458981.1 permease [Methylibium sp.]